MDARNFPKASHRNPDDYTEVAGMGWQNTGGNGDATSVWRATQAINGLQAMVTVKGKRRAEWALWVGAERRLACEGGHIHGMTRNEAMDAAMRWALAHPDYRFQTPKP